MSNHLSRSDTDGAGAVLQWSEGTKGSAVPDERVITIVIAEDDEEDRMLTEEAFAEARLANPVKYVCDGIELMDYLRRRNRYSAPGSAPRPGLILLDLNMPRMNGREALREIKNDAELRDIPVVILTTSKAEEDVVRSYALGGNSFIVKPVTFPALLETVKTITRYWCQLVRLPNHESEGRYRVAEAESSDHR